MVFARGKGERENGEQLFRHRVAGFQDERVLKENGGEGSTL